MLDSRLSSDPSMIKGFTYLPGLTIIYVMKCPFCAHLRQAMKIEVCDYRNAHYTTTNADVFPFYSTRRPRQLTPSVEDNRSNQ